MVAFAQTGDTKPYCKEILGLRNSVTIGGDQVDEAKTNPRSVRRRRQRLRSRKESQKDLHNISSMAVTDIARDEGESHATSSMKSSTPVIGDEAGALVSMAKVCSTTLRSAIGSVMAHESDTRPTRDGASALSPSPVSAQRDTVQEPVAARSKPFTKRVWRTRRKCQPKTGDANEGSVVVGVSQELGPGQEANNSAKPKATTTTGEVTENNKPHDAIVGRKPKNTNNSKRNRGAKNRFQFTSPRLSVDSGNTLQRQGPTPLKQPSLHNKNFSSFKSSAPSAQTASAITIYNGNTTTKVFGRSRRPRSRILATPSMSSISNETETFVVASC